MESQTEKDKLRSSVIDELISAKNWFTLVADENKVKVFSCTDAANHKRGIVNIIPVG